MSFDLHLFLIREGGRGGIRMEIKKLDKSVLKLWYIRAGIGSLALVGVFVSAVVVLTAAGASGKVTLAVLTGIGIPVALLLAFVLILPALRYQSYAWVSRVS